MKVFRTRVYTKRARKLLSAAEVVAAEIEILEAPESWPVIAGTGGVRKARASRGNSGKSGGVRILYYYVVEDSVYLLDIYAKNERANIAEAEKKEFRMMVKELKEKHHGKKIH